MAQVIDATKQLAAGLSAINDPSPSVTPLLVPMPSVEVTDLDGDSIQDGGVTSNKSPSTKPPYLYRASNSVG